MDAPKCKLCGERHWSHQDHGGALTPAPVVVVPKKKPTRKFSVYGLIDPRDGAVFYIGCTYDLPQRIRAHHSCPASSPVYPVNAAIRAEGLRIAHKVYGEYDSGTEARWVECELILATDGLVNSKDPVCHGTLSRLFFPPGVVPTAKAFATFDEWHQ